MNWLDKKRSLLDGFFEPTIRKIQITKFKTHKRLLGHTRYIMIE